MIDYIKDSETWFDKFEDSKSILRETITSTRRNFSSNLEKVKKESKIIIKNHTETIIFLENIEKGELLLCFFGVCFFFSSAGFLILMLKCLDKKYLILVLLGLIIFIVCFFSAFAVGVYYGDMYSTVIVLEKNRETAEKLPKVYQEALKVLLNYSSLISNDSIIIQDKHNYMEEINTQKDKILNHIIIITEKDIDYLNLMNRITMINQACQKIIATIGDEGTCPVSSKPNKLVDCLIKKTTHCV